jgi:MFS family permease
MKEMASKTEFNRVTSPYTLLGTWVERSRLSWLQASLIVGLVLLALVLVAAFADGIFNHPFDPRYWRITLLGPAVVLYIFAAHPQIRRLRREAIEAFRPIVKMSSPEFDTFVDLYLPLKRRHEWLVFFASALLGEMILRPWTVEDALPLFWTKGYRILLTGIMCGLMGAVIYTSLACARFLARLHRRPLHLNIFDMTPLEPIARCSLFYTLVLIGGVTLGLVFIPNQDARGMVINSAVMLAAISIFFLSMRDTHAIMLKLKKQELVIARQHLATLHDKLVEESDNVQAEVLIKMAPTTNAWLTYEKRIDQAPEWPFTSPMLRKLLVSVLIPITLFILQRVANEFLTQLMMKQ